MANKESEFDKGRTKGHKDSTWNKEHPWTTGAGGGYNKPSGKSDDYDRGYEKGKEQAKKGK